MPMTTSTADYATMRTHCPVFDFYAVLPGNNAAVNDVTIEWGG